ncbi:MAG: HEAT repeat domain-containing protein [Bacteroidota bacterium]
MLKYLLPLGLLAIIIYACAREATPPKYATEIVTVDPEGAADHAAKIRAEASVEIADGLQLDLWAADSVVQDPIALSVAPDGRVFYTSAKRQQHSEFDIRGHRDWMTASLRFQTVEDRRKFLRETFAAGSEQSEAHLKDLNEDGQLDWRDLTVEKEQVWFVTDRNGDGTADRTQRFLVDFGQEITDVANGIEFHDGEVYIGVGPDLWRAKDTDGDGTAEVTESLSHGYVVHVGFGGHGMSGVKVGPEGRIWWGVGDVGMNVLDRDGKRWKYPNRGVVVRSEPDGSNFEVFAAGVRNTHEFAFDEYGNLITMDNDGDHSGERERLVYLIDGSDTGWRINWQFGKYTDPTNNAYKVWMDEKMHLPRNEDQAAYFLPPIQNYVNGPTGLVYNPGTALSPDYYDHFFVAEFRGSPGNSPLHAFTMEPDGAGFKLGKSEALVKGLLPTGIDFGPDGALYFGDWINGWNPKREGRIWKLDVGADAGAEMGLRQSTQELLQADFSTMPTGEVMDLLGHQDQRIRQKAQFMFADMEHDGFRLLRQVATDVEADQLARIHALWGMSQILRRGYERNQDNLFPFLADADPEIVAQAARLIGDLKLPGGEEALIGLLTNTSPRVRFFAMEALGRLKVKAAVPAILDLVRANDGRDTWLRHGAMVALGRIGDAAVMEQLANDPSKEVRLTAIVALRRMASPAIAAFLDDADEYVVAEAARAINDDFSIPDALAALAAVLDREGLSSEPLLRRTINANLRVGDAAAAQRLVAYAQRKAAPTNMRAEAIAALSNWMAPSYFDRVDGRYREPGNRDQTAAGKIFADAGPGLMTTGPEAVRIAALHAAGPFGTDHEVLAGIFRNPSSSAVCIAALMALDQVGAPGLDEFLRSAMQDRDPTVRASALSLLPESKVAASDATELYADIIANGSTVEAQAALTGLGQLDDPTAEALLVKLFDQFQDGGLAPALQLDLIEAIENRDSSALTAELTAYEASLLEDEHDLGLFSTALAGGDAGEGRGVFYWNSSGQCTRCHAVFEYGGNVGPNLQGIGSRLTPEEILTSIVRPSAALAQGHETVLVTLGDGSTLSGIVLERTPEYLKVKTGKTDSRTIPTADIAEAETLPSSMPSAEGKLTRREIRDLVAFLVTQRGEAH